MNEPSKLDFAGEDQLSGFRLLRLEVFNWGTFDGKVSTLHLNGRNTLLTGDIGSGKSALVDAITTLLVPPDRIALNKPAGADSRERTLRSYVRGYSSYSVILGVFHNAGFGESVTLAQVFWLKDAKGQPARFFAAAEKDLTFAENFANFGSKIGNLRKQLRESKVQVFDNFPAYGAYFRRRFGIDNEQALELFHQTVAIKSIGNLTDFVRTHMLETFDAEPRIQALNDHFDNLNRARDAVLKTKAQIERLTPLLADCSSHAPLAEEIDNLRACHEGLKTYFTGLKADLLRGRILKLHEEFTRLNVQVEELRAQKRSRQSDERDLTRAISENGGERIARIVEEIESKQEEQKRRIKKAERYAELAGMLNLQIASSAEDFLIQLAELGPMREKAMSEEADIQNELTGKTAALKQGLAEHEELKSEIASLKVRCTNIDQAQISMRQAISTALDLPEAEMPFAGELIQVREDQKDWEGAAERLMRDFGLSLLVPDSHYVRVVEWVDRTHLRGRLVYFRVQDMVHAALSPVQPNSLVSKLALKRDTPFYSWLEREVTHRFDVACCSTQEEFRRENKAITRAGQIKGHDERHEKDDLHRLNDRSWYVLGWSNEAKIATFEAKTNMLEDRLMELGSHIAGLQSKLQKPRERIETLNKLDAYREFRDIDLQSIAADIARLQKEKRRLELTSDVLKTLNEHLDAVLAELEKTDEAFETRKEERTRTDERRRAASASFDEAEARLTHEALAAHAAAFPRIEALRVEALGEHALTVESCDSSEQDVGKWLKDHIDAEDKKLRRIRERIIDAMRKLREDYPLDTRDMDVSIDAAGEYRQMLSRLQNDDLPRFEMRLKQGLNENTIRAVADFQSQQARERQMMSEQIAGINESLTQIDYNPGRYIVLEAQPSLDPDIRDFHTELQACTEGALTGSGDEQSSEARFLQIKCIIERFRGREGRAELDRHWTKKVTDVRNAFVFSVSERTREDDTEHQHYSDSSSKFEGQKEKLAYTVLAAGLANQFHLEWGAVRSRTFRFVLIDGAFGRGSDESAEYGLRLFQQLNLQLLVVASPQEAHLIEPFVSSIGFVHNEDGASMLRNLTVEEYHAEKSAHRESTT